MQAVSCYRSAGSLPIPEQTRPAVKKRIKLSKYKEDVEELELEDLQPFTPPILLTTLVSAISLVGRIGGVNG